MELSCFYTDRLIHRFPVTMLLLEQIAIMRIEENRKEEDGETPATLEQVVRNALIVTGAKKRPSKEDVLYAFARLTAMNKKSQEVDPAHQPAKNNSNKKGFSSDYLTWVGELDHEGMCLHVADYDYDEAGHLYADIDRDSVLRMAKQKADKDWHDKMVQFEACLFGFGGGYGDGEGSNTFDMRADLESAEASIKSLGF